LSIKNQELLPGSLKVVSHYQAGLAAADDHGWDRFDAVGFSRSVYEVHPLGCHESTVEASLTL